MTPRTQLVLSDPEEQQLIRRYREFDQIGKDAVIHFMDTLTEWLKHASATAKVD